MLSSIGAHSCRAVVWSFAVSAIQLWSVPIYQATAIGPENYPGTATAISATGAVVGNYTMPDGSTRAFLWQDGQSTTLAMPGDALQAWATAIGGNGQAGGYTDSLQAPQGLIWDSSGNPVKTAGAYVMGLNTSGDAAGMAIGQDGAGYAFVTRNGVLTSLGQPAGGGWSSANSINASGAAAGTAMNADGGFQAFTVGPDGTVTLLTGLGGANSYGMSIGGGGAVAGHTQLSTGAMQAVIWNGTVATSLGSLGGANSYGYGINSSGQAVGYSDTAGAATAAFLFDNGALYNLNALLAPGSGWELTAAYAVNDAGQIVGRGLFQGVERAFLLTPFLPQTPNADAPGSSVPEPSTLWLAAPALAFLAFRMRR